jgi:hypothetical protein
METAQYASFYAFVNKFSKCDSISTIRRAGGNGPMLQEEWLIPSASLPFAFTLTQWLDSTIYEDKGA